VENVAVLKGKTDWVRHLIVKTRRFKIRLEPLQPAGRNSLFELALAALTLARTLTPCTLLASCMLLSCAVAGELRGAHTARQHIGARALPLRRSLTSASRARLSHNTRRTLSPSLSTLTASVHMSTSNLQLQDFAAGGSLL